MMLVFTSLQKEVSKPALHFTQSQSETEEGEGGQRHSGPLRPAFPPSDPKKTPKNQTLAEFDQDYKYSPMTS